MIITSQYYLKVLLKIIVNVLKAEEIKTKKKQYLYKIMTYLSELINDRKTIRNNSNEWKIEINTHVLSFS